MVINRYEEHIRHRLHRDSKNGHNEVRCVRWATWAALDNDASVSREVISEYNYVILKVIIGTKSTYQCCFILGIHIAEVV